MRPISLKSSLATPFLLFLGVGFLIGPARAAPSATREAQALADNLKSLLEDYDAAVLERQRLLDQAIAKEFDLMQQALVPSESLKTTLNKKKTENTEIPTFLEHRPGLLLLEILTQIEREAVAQVESDSIGKASTSPRGRLREFLEEGLQADIELIRERETVFFSPSLREIQPLRKQQQEQLKEIHQKLEALGEDPPSGDQLERFYLMGKTVLESVEAFNAEVANIREDTDPAN